MKNGRGKKGNRWREKSKDEGRGKNDEVRRTRGSGKGAKDEGRGTRMTLMY